MERVQFLLSPFKLTNQATDDILFRVEFAWLAVARITGHGLVGIAFDKLVIRIMKITIQDHEQGFVGIF